MYTDLTYTNLSYDANLPRIIILQKNLEYDEKQSAIAWKVVRNCGYEWSCPFRFDRRLSLALEDIHGNESPRIRVDKKGIRYKVSTKSGGGIIVNGGLDQMRISVFNRTERETFTAKVYRGDGLLACRPVVRPGEEVTFRFSNSILIGTGLRVVEGQPLHRGRLEDFKTEMDLSGLKKARIIMMGGGPGPRSKPLRFFLENKETW